MLRIFGDWGVVGKGVGKTFAVRLEKRSLKNELVDQFYPILLVKRRAALCYVHIRAELSPLPVASIPPSGLVAREITCYFFKKKRIKKKKGISPGQKNTKY